MSRGTERETERRLVDEPHDPGLLRLRLTLLLPGGVSAQGGGAGEGRPRGMAALRAQAVSASHPEAGRGLPPARMVAVGLSLAEPHGRPHGPAEGVAAAAY